MRYARHISLPEIGESGQKKLGEARVLMVGAGGLGCPALQYLAAAGIGNIGIIDSDVVSESNLQRQILYGTSDIGKKKVDAAKERLTAINPNVKIESYSENLSSQNALNVISEFDIVIDGTDNFSTRYLVNDACVKLDKPFVYGAIHKFEGQVSVFNYQGGPTYRCLFSDEPKPGQLPNCHEVGVLGVLPGVIGVYQATEAIKVILGIGNVLTGKLKVINLLNNSEQLISFERNEEQVEKARIMELQPHDSLSCGLDSKISAEEMFRWKIERGGIFDILDVREPHESPQWDISEVTYIPLGQLPNRMNELSSDRPTIVMCQHGIRSQRAIEFLRKSGHQGQLINLEGGMAAFQQLNFEHE